MSTQPAIEFIDDITGFRAPNAFIARLGGPLRRKAELLNALALALIFPKYFGRNWDALEECLRDLSWLGDNRPVVLLHKQMPLARRTQRLLYLDILKKAVLAHGGRLRVIFPAAS
ncbi:MAG TPA: barstar family protein [Lacipirellulaceae bacterium]|jgi:hypothetical protein|nr:barstar family protein [Lacipirellulaceae bacterium]